MADPAEELQGRIYTALTNDPAVMALVGGVFDRVQRNSDGTTAASVWGAQQGYISFGAEYTIHSYVECVTKQNPTLQIDIWSRQVGRIHAKRIMAEVLRVLRSIDSLDDNALGSVDISLTRLMADPDGLTIHGVIQVEFAVEVSPPPL